MALTEQRILTSVTVLPESRTVQVLWRNAILRDGSEISGTNHRRAYMESEKDQFLTDIPDGAKYVEAAGWK